MTNVLMEMEMKFTFFVLFNQNCISVSIDVLIFVHDSLIDSKGVHFAAF